MHPVAPHSQEDNERRLFDLAENKQETEHDYTAFDYEAIATGLKNDLDELERQIKRLERAEMVPQDVLEKEFSI